MNETQDYTPESHSDSLSGDQRVDAISDRFEDAWKARPSIERFLSEAPQPDRTALLRELLRLDLEYRRGRGESPSREEYAQRFPENVELINEVFTRVGPPVSPQAIADRNLHFDIRALQMDYISRDDLIEAMNTWLINKTKTLGQILRDQGQLSLERLQQLEALIPRESEPRFHKLRLYRPGGLGKVFFAEDLELHREVALKEIREDHAHDPHSRIRFLREAEITARLEHPGIVPVYGMGQYADGRPFYAMRFIKGDDLKVAIRDFHQADLPGRDPGERSLALRQLLGRFVAVCNAVAYAHSRGVIHRDLKPANILLGKYGETLVGDWGLAKVVGRPEIPQRSEDGTVHPHARHELPTESGTPLGTPPYMSPEQATGHPDLGPASDIYSLGATLYELLTGLAPVQGSNRAEILEKVKRGDWLPPGQLKSQTPPALDAICCKAMALNPKDRYATAQDLANDIERWLGEEPVTAYREKFMSQSVRWMKKHRSGVTTSVGTMLLIAHREAEEQRNQMLPQLDLRQGRCPMARDIRCKYYAKLNESMKWEDHFLKPRRKRVLGMALELYEQFMQEERDELHMQAGLGRPSSGLTNLYQAECARAYLRLADLYSTIGAIEKAEKAYQEAVAIFSHLVKTCPQRADYQEDLGATHNNLGVLYSASGRSVDAEASYQDALDIQTELVKLHPHEGKYQKDLAGSFNNLSILHSDTGCDDKAEAAYQEVLAIRKKLATAHPEVVEYSVDLSQSHCNLGHLVGAIGNPQAARQCYEYAIQILRGVLQKEPQHETARRLLFYAHWGRAEALTWLGHHTEALQDWDGAMRLANQQYGTELQLGRAVTLARAGDHALATAQASELAKGRSFGSDTLYQLARVYSLASAAARQDAQLPLSERGQLAEEYAAHAVKLLHKVRASDLGKVPAGRGDWADKDLDPLRSRSDFKKLLTKVKKKL
jgi:serine/threonine-protein kinase